jgi:hypothetical protein
MGRVYTISAASVAVSAVQDLLTVFAGSNKAFALHSVTIGQTTATAVGNLAISIKRLAGTLTNGSGGSTPTPVPVDPGGAAATVTAHANDTTRTTTSGTSTVVVADVLNVINGYFYLPPAEDRIVFGLGNACVVSLDTAPASTEAMSVTVTIEELF